MVSESYITKRLEELKKLDITRNLIIIELNQFYGIYDAITTEAIENNIKLDGVYKEFCDVYKQKSNEHSKLLNAKLNEDAEWCDKMLKIIGDKNE